MTVIPQLQPIVMVCAADNNYAMPLAVTVRSALANLRSDRQIVLFILDGGISNTKKSKIIRSLDSKQLKISWIQLDHALFANLPLLVSYFWLVHLQKYFFT